MGQSKAYRQLALQTIITLVGAMSLLVFANARDAYSVFLGGVAVIIPTYLFILCAFRYSGARAASKILGAFFIGEMIKFVSMAALIITVLKFTTAQPLVFLLAFLSVQVLSAIIGFLWPDRKVVEKVAVEA